MCLTLKALGRRLLAPASGTSSLRDTIRGLVYESITGVVAFDNGSDRLAPYDIMNMRVNGSGFATLKLIGIYNGVTNSVQFSVAPVFANGTTTVAVDVRLATRLGTSKQVASSASFAR